MCMCVVSRLNFPPKKRKGRWNPPKKVNGGIVREKRILLLLSIPFLFPFESHYTKSERENGTKQGVILLLKTGL